MHVRRTCILHPVFQETLAQVKCFFSSLFHSFKKCLLSTSNSPDTMLGIRNLKASKTQSHSSKDLQPSLETAGIIIEVEVTYGSWDYREGPWVCGNWPPGWVLGGWRGAGVGQNPGSVVAGQELGPAGSLGLWGLTGRLRLNEPFQNLMAPLTDG